MTESSWTSRAARVRRTRQYGGRVRRTEAGREGMKEEVRKKREREAELTCESHYSDSSSNTTFLKLKPFPLISLPGPAPFF